MRSTILRRDRIRYKRSRRKTHNHILRNMVSRMTRLYDRLVDTTCYTRYISDSRSYPVLATLSHTRESTTSERSILHIIDTRSDTIESEIDRDESMIIMYMRETKHHEKKYQNMNAIVHKYERKSTICKKREHVTYWNYI